MCTSEVFHETLRTIYREGEVLGKIVHVRGVPRTLRTIYREREVLGKIVHVRDIKETSRTIYRGGEKCLAE